MLWCHPGRYGVMLKGNIRSPHILRIPKISLGALHDMQWGQGLQLIEDFDAANSGGDRAVAPAPFSVTEGEELLLTVRMSVPCRQTFQFTLQRVKADA
eukprot:symbB.v1.2.017111.t1/scaffold1276.1/size127259/2